MPSTATTKPTRIERPAPASFTDEPYVAIPMTGVKSNQVKAIGYDARTKTLAVTFTRGSAIYHYPDVPAKLHAEFVRAKSHGRFFDEHIRPLSFKKYRAPEPTKA